MSNVQQKSASELAARLMAVQSVYENLMTGRKTKDAAGDYLDDKDRFADIQSEMDMSMDPDRKVFARIISIIDERAEDLKTLIGGHYNNKAKPLEPLLSAILLCGTAEIFAETGDKALIINDYLDLTHGFYDKNEVSLINGILDGISKNL